MITGEVKGLPSWFRQDLPDMERIRKMQGLFRGKRLHTVCESAHCPNMGKCWGQGVATFMILGEICTRACRFCAVAAGRPPAVDPDEPRHLASAVQSLELRYVVITSVARDDLPDEGADQFIRTIEETRRLNPGIKIEILVPDFSNRLDLLKKIIAAKPEVMSHNMETVRRLSPLVRPQAGYDRSLAVLANLKRLNPDQIVKTSIMIGLGEREGEITELMSDVRCAGCDILTIGQYLRPTALKRHLPVEEFVPLERFAEYRQRGLQMGFRHVMSSPLVRSSYIAEEGYKECLEKTRPQV